MSEEKVEHSYDESDIQVLEGLEAVRKRPGMYIGTTSIRGLHHLVWEIVDNSIDEALAGYASHIRVILKDDDVVQVIDNGRGMPTGTHAKTGISTVETIFTVLHAGGKFGGGGYKVSGGLHGVGASVVNALSQWLEVNVHREGHEFYQRFENGGKPVGELKIIGDSDITGTIVTFKADKIIFKEGTVYDYDTLRQSLSGGVGVPYRPDQPANDIAVIGEGVRRAYEDILVPAGMGDVSLCTELGRFMLAPYGHLVTTVLHQKHTHKEYIGVDACAANLMRPAIYGAYHHITVMGKETAPCDHMYDVTGSLCENSDKFAIDRMLPEVETGDLLVIHDTGAHGHAMGYQYNGRLRSAEVLLCEDGSTRLIRRAETPEDYFATAIWD